ncbi:hypothetical protein CFP56_008746 [Quercus suber]|uniref:Uncharacterized protein n=1 Tax=Quercus suber TaxID=58331 RepID=A0AAW0M680_QUESU
MAMEELHMAAHAYYNNSNTDLKNKALDFFNSMDSMEMVESATTSSSSFSCNTATIGQTPTFTIIWTAITNGLLDFWEVLTLYYIMKTRSVRCQCCTACQIGLYFTCVTCFHSASHTFDICIGCYSTQKYRQQHDRGFFLDSYVLLRSKKGPPPGLPDLNQALVPVQPTAVINTPERALVPVQSTVVINTPERDSSK